MFLSYVTQEICNVVISKMAPSDHFKFILCDGGPQVNKLQLGLINVRAST